MRLCERLFSHVWFALHVKPYFLFPDVLKRWSFQKNTRKYYIFFKLSEKMAFPKRAAPAHDLSCIIWKDGIFSENMIFFPGQKVRGSLSQEIHGNMAFWNMIFLLLSRKMIFLFPEKMILSLRRKMKDDLSQKNTRKYYIFFKLSEKMAFPKRAAPAHDLSCIIWKDGIFFRKHDIFPWAESKRRSFSGNTWKYDIFCVHVRVLQT